ncbi:MAG: RHS repeat-associated core domain-containing protein [Armatimonadetes bacterium]|nr:RHS repeat-associated core domain-containing protein [Armatimonadota bacterium]MDE2206989.1 RHS repeat-associated core domain-containing protein [Armatimonadota bacterium]
MATQDFDAFGNTIASSGSTSSPYNFAGDWAYQSNGDAGLQHVGARYYDPQIGRFASRDSMLDQVPYAYCGGEPNDWVDPSGHWNWKVILGGIVVVIGAAVIPVGSPIIAGLIVVVAIAGAIWGDVSEGGELLHRAERIIGEWIGCIRRWMDPPARSAWCKPEPHGIERRSVL